MKSMSRITRLAVIGGLALVSAAWVAAQGPMRCCMRGGMPRYDTANEATYKGTVDEIKYHDRAGMAGTETHLIVKSDDKTLDVHLGPTDFLAAQQMTFTKGTRLKSLDRRLGLATPKRSSHEK